MSNEVGIERKTGEDSGLEPKFKTFATQIAEGFGQAERGELLDADQAIRILQDRRAKRQSPQKARLTHKLTHQIEIL